MVGLPFLGFVGLRYRLKWALSPWLKSLRSFRDDPRQSLSCLWMPLNTRPQVVYLQRIRWSLPRFISPQIRLIFRTLEPICSLSGASVHWLRGKLHRHFSKHLRCPLNYFVSTRDALINASASVQFEQGPFRAWVLFTQSGYSRNAGSNSCTSVSHPFRSATRFSVSLKVY